MAKRNPQQKLEIDKVGASAVAGNVKISEEGVFIGRDRIEGWKPDQVMQLVETMLKYIPKGIEPARLDVALKELGNLLSTLYEWKEVHNALDAILNAYFQYRDELDRQSGLRQRPDTERIRLRWKAVIMEVEEIIDLARNIKFIDEPYKEIDDQNGRKLELGPKWAIEIGQLCEQINTILQISEAPEKESLFLGVLGVKPPWWKDLENSTKEFHHSAYWHMHKVDKKLRETAIQLAELTHEILGRTQI